MSQDTNHIEEISLYLLHFNFRSHFILGGLNYYVLTSKNKYNVLIVFILYCKILLLLLRWDMCEVWVGLRMGQQCNYKCNYRN